MLYFKYNCLRMIIEDPCYLRQLCKRINLLQKLQVYVNIMYIQML